MNDRQKVGIGLTDVTAAQGNMFSSRSLQRRATGNVWRMDWLLLRTQLDRESR